MIGPAVPGVPLLDHRLMLLAASLFALAHALGFGGVQITWKRQPSHAPLTATLADVTATDPAFAYSWALAASGITAGCAGGSFCSAMSLTRRQMAVFLARALGLHWSVGP